MGDLDKQVKRIRPAEAGREIVARGGLRPAADSVDCAERRALRWFPRPRRARGGTARRRARSYSSGTGRTLQYSPRPRLDAQSWAPFPRLVRRGLSPALRAFDRAALSGCLCAQARRVPALDD